MLQKGEQQKNNNSNLNNEISQNCLTLFKVIAKINQFRAFILQKFFILVQTFGFHYSFKN